MDMIAERVTLPESEDAARLPRIIKREAFASHLESSSLLARSRDEAELILARANEAAERLSRSAETAARESERRGYLEGLERARVEMAARMLELSEMADDCVRHVEGAVADVVISAVTEIVSGFDDATLVASVVERAQQRLGPDVRLSLFVTPTLCADVGHRLVSLAGAESVRVVGDDALQGSECRVESATMVVVGDVEEQLSAMRTALEHRIVAARDAAVAGSPRTEPAEEAPAPPGTGTITIGGADEDGRAERLIDNHERDNGERA